jgi:predicted TIM-barrel fold metal-dependent hydrolase
MNVAFVGAVMLAVLVGVVFFLLFNRLIARQKETRADAEWCRDFSIARYRPMERLFVEEDYDFLMEQPGFHPGIYRKLQAERRRVFRHYLRCLRRDFDRLSAAAKVMLVHAAEDRPDLATTLLKQRCLFNYAMLVVQVRLALQTMGLGRVDVRRLVSSLEQMRDQLRELAPQGAAI